MIRLYFLNEKSIFAWFDNCKIRIDNCEYERLLNLVKTLNSVLNIIEKTVTCPQRYYGQKKQKDRLEGSLCGVLFYAEFEFPKIQVPTIPHNSSNVNIECAGKSKQLHSLSDQLLGSLIYFYFIFLY